jgi:hypothetical protein
MGSVLSIGGLMCVSSAWTPWSHLHAGNVQWAASGGDGSAPPSLSLAWGAPLLGFADAWVDRDHAEVTFFFSRLRARSCRRLARALCAEILRRAAALGATQAVVGPRGDDAIRCVAGSTKGSACARSPNTCPSPGTSLDAARVRRSLMRRRQ